MGASVRLAYLSLVAGVWKELIPYLMHLSPNSFPGANNEQGIAEETLMCSPVTHSYKVMSRVSDPSRVWACVGPL